MTIRQRILDIFGDLDATDAVCAAVADWLLEEAKRQESPWCSDVDPAPVVLRSMAAQLQEKP